MPLDSKLALTTLIEHSLPKELRIKPDMSAEERQMESLLLKERWALIQSGIERKVIRICSNKIFVHNKLHGQIINSSLVLTQSSHPVSNMESSNNWLSPENSHANSTPSKSDVGRERHNLKILLWNARSLNKQINAFQSYVYSVNFDIIAITETWLSNNISQMKDFPLLLLDRDSRCGGVLLALKSSLTTMQLPSPSDLEIVSAEIDPNLLLCLIYHPPTRPNSSTPHW